MLLDAERVYRELSTILEGEADLDFASIMVQVFTFFRKIHTCKMMVFVTGLAFLK